MQLINAGGHPLSLAERLEKSFFFMFDNIPVKAYQCPHQ
jgi:hypothetical protein